MHRHWVILGICSLLVVGCAQAEPVCPPDSVGLLAPDASGTALQPTSLNPGEVEINGKPQEFDQVLHGPLCDAALAGNIYIACDVQVKAWTTAPNFLDGCPFNVAEGSEITVAAHNNEVYYKGCAACHTSQ